MSGIGFSSFRPATCKARSGADILRGSDARRSQRAVLVRVAPHELHDAAPVHHARAPGVAVEVRAPEPVQGLAAQVVAARAHGVGELLLVHEEAPLRVHLTKYRERVSEYSVGNYSTTLQSTSDTLQCTVTAKIGTARLAQLLYVTKLN